MVVGASGDSALSAVWARIGPFPTQATMARAIRTLDWPGPRTRCGGLRTAPPWADLATIYNRTLDPILERLGCGWPTQVQHGLHTFTYAHFVWTLCCPCVDWIDHVLGGNTDTTWPPAMNMCMDLLAPDFMCHDTKDSAMDLEAMSESLAFMVNVHLGVTLPLESIGCVLCPLVHAGMPACTMGVNLTLMSHVMETFVGKSMHEQLKCTLLALAANTHAPTPATPLADLLAAELVALLAEKHKRTTAWEDAPLVLDTQESPLKRRRAAAEPLGRSEVRRAATHSALGARAAWSTGRGSRMHGVICSARKHGARLTDVRARANR